MKIKNHNWFCVRRPYIMRFSVSFRRSKENKSKKSKGFLSKKTKRTFFDRSLVKRHSSSQRELKCGKRKISDCFFFLFSLIKFEVLFCADNLSESTMQ
jgi:hypothetical protein